MLVKTTDPKDSMATVTIVESMGTRRLNAANANARRKIVQPTETTETTGTTTETEAPIAMMTDATTIVITDRMINGMTTERNNLDTMENWSARSVGLQATQPKYVDNELKVLLHTEMSHTRSKAHRKTMNSDENSKGLGIKPTQQTKLLRNNKSMMNNPTLTVLNLRVQKMLKATSLTSIY